MALTALLAAVVASLVAVAGRQTLWRASYPYLPRRLQAAPYVVRGALSRASTPVPLPTALSAAAAMPQLPTPEAVLPSPTALAALAATPAPILPTPVPPPASALIPAPPHQYQTWNNCGPATIAMALGILERSVPQSDAARVLKPDPDDKNVSPDELAEFARSQGLVAAVRTGGTLEELKRLVAIGVPVVAETWFIPDPGDEMGHYVLVHGYDDGADVLVTADSYEGPGQLQAYDHFDALWRVFNRLYVAVYPTELVPAVSAIWGVAADPQVMHRNAAAAALAEISVAPDAFGWFNLGSSLAAVGDPAAEQAYDEARELGLPWRMLWYQFGPMEAYARAGRWADVRALADANLANAPNLEESLYWLGRSREATGDAVGARSAYESALTANPLYAPPRDALAELR